jgi:hypothetical protein
MLHLQEDIQSLSSFDNAAVGGGAADIVTGLPATGLTLGINTRWACLLIHGILIPAGGGESGSFSVHTVANAAAIVAGSVVAELFSTTPGSAVLEATAGTPIGQYPLGGAAAVTLGLASRDVVGSTNVRGEAKFQRVIDDPGNTAII